MPSSHGNSSSPNDHRATYQKVIESGKASLGIELGSTRIKSCLIDEHGTVLGIGSARWQDSLVDGHWSYSLDSVWNGIEQSYAQLRLVVKEKYGVELRRLKSCGISAMMHGYLAFDDSGNQLCPFRTWRDTTTATAAEELTRLFGVNIPMRWSVAHYYQALSDKEAHVSSVSFLTTLAGYVHWRLTGEKVLGIGDASGMFPCSDATQNYDRKLLSVFDSSAEKLGVTCPLDSLLPRVLLAGDNAGSLTAEGALLLDPTGTLSPGAPCCPPEGDAGTGMVATNAVRPRTGNMSVGTSIFAMIVMDKNIDRVHEEIDPVMTPAGAPVAMVHCNNGAAELSEWIELFSEVAVAFGKKQIVDIDDVYSVILTEALHGAADAGGLLVYNYRSGEPVARVADGRPLLVRSSEAKLSLANVVRANIYSVFATLALGMRILAKENVKVDFLHAHGGIFKTANVAQRFAAAALNTSIRTSPQAGEGGAWGVALLALYAAGHSHKPLDEFLDSEVFASDESQTFKPLSRDVAGFADYLERFEKGLALQEAAPSAVPNEASEA